MVLIGCDFEGSWQQVSWMNEATGETEDREIVHTSGEVEKFYRQFPAGGIIGMEGTGDCQGFFELMASLRHGGGIGDAGEIWGSEVRQQKDDQRDGRLLLELLAERRVCQSL